MRDTFRRIDLRRVLRARTAATIAGVSVLPAILLAASACSAQEEPTSTPEPTATSEPIVDISATGSASIALELPGLVRESSPVIIAATPTASPPDPTSTVVATPTSEPTSTTQPANTATIASPTPTQKPATPTVQAGVETQTSAGAVLVSQQITLQQTNTVDLDTGLIGQADSDLWFQAVSNEQRYFTTRSGSYVAGEWIDPPTFNDCLNAVYSSGSIDVTALTPGRYLCVLTSSQNLARVRLLSEIPPAPAAAELELLTWQLGSVTVSEVPEAAPTPTPTRPPAASPTPRPSPTVAPTATVAPTSVPTPVIDPVIIFEGELAITQTSTVDLETGVRVGGQDDVQFAAVSATERYLSPIFGNSEIAQPSSTEPGYEGCRDAAYGGQVDVNDWQAGQYICVLTNEGNYSQVMLIAPVLASDLVMNVYATTWSTDADAVPAATPTPTPAATEAPEPVVIFTGQAEIATNQVVDLETGDLVFELRSEFRFVSTGAGQGQLEPASVGARSALVGLVEPDYFDCADATLQFDAVEFDTSNIGDFICALTGQGNISRLEILPGSFEEPDPVLRVEITTWSLEPELFVTPTPTLVPTATTIPTPVATPTVVPSPEPTPEPVEIHSGRTDMSPNETVDVETGKIGSGAGQDIRYVDLGPGEGRLEIPSPNARIAFMGSQEPGYEGCSQANLSFTPLVLSTNDLGDYVCVRSNEGNYAQLLILDSISQFSGEFNVIITTWTTNPDFIPAPTAVPTSTVETILTDELLWSPLQALDLETGIRLIFPNEDLFPDVRYQQNTGEIEPEGSAQISLLPPGQTGLTACQNAAYSTQSIHVDDWGLAEVICVITAEDNLSQMLLTGKLGGAPPDLTVQVTTWDIQSQF